MSRGPQTTTLKPTLGGEPPRVFYFLCSLRLRQTFLQLNLIFVRKRRQMSNSILSMRIPALFFWMVFFATSFAEADKTWDASSEAILVDLLCADDSYFKKCFDVTTVKCRAAVRDAASNCRTASKSISDAVRAQAKVGLCIGTRIEKSWADRKSSANQCGNREHWQ